MKNENIESNDFINVMDVGNRIFCINGNNELYYIGNDSIKIIKYNKLVEEIFRVFICNGNEYISCKKGMFEYEIENDSILIVNDYLVEENYGANCVNDSFSILSARHGERSIYLKKNNNITPLGTWEYGSYNTYRNGFQWSTYNQTLLLYEEGKVATFSNPTKSKPTRILEQDEFDFLMTDNGVFLLSKEGNIILYFLENKEIINSYVDSRNNIWILTRTNGVYMIPDQIIWNHKDAYLLSMIALCKDSSNIYFASKKGRVGLIGNPVVPYEELFDGKGESYDLAYKNDNLYICGSFPTIKYNITSNEKEYFEVGGKTLYIDRDDKLYLGYDALYLHDRTAITKTSGTLRVYAILKEGNIVWTGTSEGLVKVVIDNDSLISEQKINNLQYNVSDITRSPLDELWVTTKSHGIFRLTENDTIHYSTKNILPTNECNRMAFDDENNCWLATNNGVVKILYPYNEIRHFTYDDLLLSNSVQDVEVLGGYLYAATDEGISILNLKEDYKYSPPIYIHTITVSQEGVYELSKSNLAQQKLAFNYNKNNVTINYEAPFFNGKVTYNCELYNNGEKVSTIKKEELEINYPFLSSGSYTFKVTPIIYGAKSDNPAILEFRIKKPWWGTNGFRISALFLFLTTVGLLFKWRTRINKRKEKEKSIINKKFAELELNALQAQMNPHFIFNALNSIQDFILSNDELSSNNYLTKFSRLMRKLLEASKSKYISLKEELDLVLIYIELEQLRFQDKFDFKLIVDERIISENIEIPSMLIQPFVENAIAHGLVFLDKKGLLEIIISQKEKQIIEILVRDNGIGRKKQGNIKINPIKGINLEERI